MKRRRKSRYKQEEEGAGTERWLVSYADFITLLFAFFVVLYATSSRNLEKEQDFQESIKKYMSLFVTAGYGAPNSQGGTTTSPNSGGALIEGLQNPAPVQNPSAQVQGEITKILRQDFSEGKYSTYVQNIRRDKAGVHIILPTEVYFESDSLKLKKEGLQALTKIGSVLEKAPYLINIEGHTLEANWELSAGQAAALVRFFIKVSGVSANRLSAQGFADQRPAVPKDDLQHRGLNQRLEVVLLTSEELED
jgi:chemotaxis protein MotB